jgi:hypothetical protein
MASPPIPPLAEYLARRPFAFYPAIVNAEHNQWFFRRATWSELVVVNGKSGMELSIPRRFVGEVSSIDEPVLIVGLCRELEYRDGAVWPHRRRVLEMPVAVGADESIRPVPPPARRNGPAPVVGIRLETRRSSRTVKLVGGAMAAAVFLGGVTLVRDGAVRTRAVPVRARAVFDLTADDGYASVVRKLGTPSEERVATEDGQEYRALMYPDRKVTVLLRGQENEARYIGAVDPVWNPIHAVRQTAGGSTLGLLRGLKRF